MTKFDGTRLREQLLHMVSEWLVSSGKRHQLIGDRSEANEGGQRKTLTAWFSGFLRGYRIWDQWLSEFCAKPPRRKVRVLLLAAIATVWNSREEQRPIQVNEWVRLAQSQVSPQEARMVNAILRRVLREGNERLLEWRNSQEKPGLAWSHPDWLVERWQSAWGVEKTREILEWNQRTPDVYLRWASNDPVPAMLEPTFWPGFFHLPSDHTLWMQWICDGQAYIQDPATRIAVELLTPRPEENLLEWCASPGGKSLLLAHARSLAGSEQAQGRHLAVDLPGRKLQMLKENLSRYPVGRKIECLGANILEVPMDVFQAPDGAVGWDVLFLDAPCSNTGVIARKPEVRYRLTRADFSSLALLQESLLARAAQCVRTGGRLLYSTCSIEEEENEGRVEDFLRKHPQWRLAKGQRWLPPECGHDGGGAFLLEYVC